MISCTVVLLYRTWSEEALHDSLLRFWLLVRVFVFVMQVPPRGEIFLRLEGACTAQSRVEAIELLLELSRSPVWKINQIFGVFLYAWFGFAFLFVYAAHGTETPSTLSALVIANIACFFLHMTFSIFWFRMMLNQPNFEGAMWKRGASKSAVDRFTRVINFDPKVSEAKKFNASCRICFEDYRTGCKVRLLPCKHHYHVKCIDPWLVGCKKDCPLCKRSIDDLVVPGKSSASLESKLD